MSTVLAMPPVKRPDQNTPSAPPAASAAVPFHYTQTEGFVALLTQLGASLLVSTYQANKLLVARVTGTGLSMLVRTFDKPMGLAVDGSRLAIGTRKEIWFLRNAPDIAPRIEPAGQHDACYLPRSSHITGDIGVHEMAWARTGSKQDIVGGLKPKVVSQTPDTMGGRITSGVGVANDTTVFSEDGGCIARTRNAGKTSDSTRPGRSDRPIWGSLADFAIHGRRTSLRHRQTLTRRCSLFPAHVKCLAQRVDAINKADSCQSELSGA